MRSALEEEFNRTAAKSRAKASKSQFLWAMAVVMSRAFSLAALPDIPYGLPPASLADPFFSGSKMVEAVMKAGNWPESSEGEVGGAQEGGRVAGDGPSGGASSLLVDSLVADFGLDEWQRREGRVSRFSEPIMLLPLADLADHDWNATLAVQVGPRHRGHRGVQAGRVAGRQAEWQAGRVGGREGGRQNVQKV